MTRSGRKVVVAGIIALALGLTACGSCTTTTATSATPTWGSVTGTQTPAAAISTDPPITLPASQAPVSPLDAWCNGTGGNDFQTVEDDMSQLLSDSQDNDASAMEVDGLALFRDAGDAVGYLPLGARPASLITGWTWGISLSLATGSPSGTSPMPTRT